MGLRIGADDESAKAFDDGLVKDCNDRPAQLLGNGSTKDLDDGPGPAQLFDNGSTKDLDEGPGPAQALNDEPAVHDINGLVAVPNDALGSELGTGYIMSTGRTSGSDIVSLQYPLLVL